MCCHRVVEYLCNCELTLQLDWKAPEIVLYIIKTLEEMCCTLMKEFYLTQSLQPSESHTQSGWLLSRSFLYLYHSEQCVGKGAKTHLHVAKDKTKYIAPGVSCVCS